MRTNVPRRASSARRRRRCDSAARRGARAATDGQDGRHGCHFSTARRGCRTRSPSRVRSARRRRPCRHRSRHDVVDGLPRPGRKRRRAADRRLRIPTRPRLHADPSTRPTPSALRSPPRRKLAEREGFEPPVGLLPHLISSQARSTGLRHLSAVSALQLLPATRGLPEEPLPQVQVKGGRSLPALGWVVHCRSCGKRPLWTDEDVRESLALLGRATRS